jgi:signal transduction histidine kinase
MEDIWQRIYQSALNFMVPQATEEVYQLVVKEAIKLVGADYGSVFLVKDQSPVRVYTSSPILNDVEARPGGKIYQVYTTGNPYLIEVQKNTDHPEFRELGIKSGLGIPLIYGHITIGVLSILSKKKPLTPEDVELLQLFAPLATLAVRKAYLNQELKNAVESRDLFMSLAAHELKTPLTVISAYSELLLRNTSNEKDKEYATKIHNELYRLKNLINEFLQIDSDKKGGLQYNMQEHDLSVIIHDVVDNFRKSIKSHKVRYRNLADGDSTLVHADVEKLLQVFTNVLNNAAKFSPKDSTIQVSLKAQDKSLNVEVKDQGQGIAVTDLEHIFERFYRGSSNKPGMGLGLYLSKQIIDKHQGTIHIESTVNKGTLVSITIPSAFK